MGTRCVLFRRKMVSAVLRALEDLEQTAPLTPRIPALDLLDTTKTCARGRMPVTAVRGVSLTVAIMAPSWSGKFTPCT